VAEASTTRLSLFVAVRLVEAIERELADAFEATFAETDDSLAELRESATPFDAMLFSLDLKMGRAEIESLPNSVRALATYSVGTDHIDLDAAREHDLVVLNTPGVLADSVAENALLLMLGAARRATESIDLVRSRRWSGWTPTQLVGVQLGGRTLGILGMGDIGKRIAVRARALGMEILYSNRRPLPADELFSEGFRSSAAELIRDSDVLLLACPSTDETRGIVDAELLAQAKPGLILVNIARGDLVVDEALVEALRAGRVWAAALDVFDGEPDIASAYYDRPNVFMLPHTGSSTIEARMGMGLILIDGLRRWRAGEEIPNQVR